MVTMMTTTNNNNRSTGIGGQPYFYNCCASHPPPPYFHPDAESNEEIMDKANPFMSPSTSTMVDNDGCGEKTDKCGIDNNNSWNAASSCDNQNRASIDYNSVDGPVDRYSGKTDSNFDDGKNNNHYSGMVTSSTDSECQRSADLLNSNYLSSSTGFDDALKFSCNSQDAVSSEDEASGRDYRAAEGDYGKRIILSCAHSNLQTPVGISAAAKQQRAKSADISSFAASLHDSSPYFYCKYPPPSFFEAPSVGIGDSTTSIDNADGGMVRSADATPIVSTATRFRLVPSCKALRMAVLALYRLDDFDRAKIGQGFFSEVFKVRHKVTGEQLALKLNTMSSNRPNVLREVQTMRRLKHPNVLRFRGVCVDKGQLHALTEYCNGGAMEQLIKGGGNVGTSAGSSASLTPFPWLIRAKLAADIARGMQYVHSCGYIHRDLTSKNVLLKRDDYDGIPYRYTAVIADFGLSCKVPKPSTKLAAVGTPYWMAPECLNDEVYTEIADVFSYGIILCEVIARIDADPDVMPRTSTFGLDYVRFSELCPLDTPVDFLKLAFRCCLMDPNSRPNFDQIVPLALNLMKTLQEPPAPALLPRQISHVLAANGVSPTHYATIANTPSYASGNENAYYQRFTITNGTRVQLMSTPLKLVRCHSDIGISGGEEMPAMSGDAKLHDADSGSAAKGIDDDRTSQSPSSALNRALAHRIAADDPFYVPADDGESVNPFAGDRRFAGGKKIVTDSCYASPSVLGNLDGPSNSLNGTPPLLSAGLGSAVLGVAACHRRFTIWKQCHGGLTLTGGGISANPTTPPMRRAHSLPCSPVLSPSAQANGYLYVDVKEINDCCAANNALDSSDEQQTIHKQESPNHVQVRRVTQVFEEQDKLFVDNRQRQKKSMKKALTISAVDGSDGMSPLVDAGSNAPSFFTFCSTEPAELEIAAKEDGKTMVDYIGTDSVPLDLTANSQPVLLGAVDMKRNATVVKGVDAKSSKRVERVKRGSRRQRKRKDRNSECDDCGIDDENSVEASCGGSLQSNCALL